MKTSVENRRGDPRCSPASRERRVSDPAHRGLSLALYLAMAEHPATDRVLQPREVSLLRVSNLEYHSHGVLRAYRRRSTSSLVDGGRTCCQPDKSTNCNDCADELSCSPRLASTGFAPNALAFCFIHCPPNLGEEGVVTRLHGFHCYVAGNRRSGQPGGSFTRCRNTQAFASAVAPALIG